jgi:type III secretion protein F
MSDVGHIGSFLNRAMEGVTAKNEAFKTRMDAMMSSEEGVNQDDMIMLQFEMGQYNAMIESIANVTKSLTDTLKSLAQKAG